jgi:hypothetical protein
MARSDATIQGAKGPVAPLGEGLRLRRIEVLHLRNVRSGDERLFACARHQQCARAAVPADLSDCRSDFIQCVGIERVERFGPVDREQIDAGFGGGEGEIGVHA